MSQVLTALVQASHMKRLNVWPFLSSDSVSKVDSASRLPRRDEPAEDRPPPMPPLPLCSGHEPGSAGSTDRRRILASGLTNAALVGEPSMAAALAGCTSAVSSSTRRPEPVSSSRSPAIHCSTTPSSMASMLSSTVGLTRVRQRAATLPSTTPASDWNSADWCRL